MILFTHINKEGIKDFIFLAEKSTKGGGVPPHHEQNENVKKMWKKKKKSKRMRGGLNHYWKIQLKFFCKAP